MYTCAVQQFRLRPAFSYKTGACGAGSAEACGFRADYRLRQRHRRRNHHTIDGKDVCTNQRTPAPRLQHPQSAHKEYSTLSLHACNTCGQQAYPNHTPPPAQRSPIDDPKIRRYARAPDVDKHRSNRYSDTHAFHRAICLVTSSSACVSFLSTTLTIAHTVCSCDAASIDRSHKTQDTMQKRRGKDAR